MCRCRRSHGSLNDRATTDGGNRFQDTRTLSLSHSKKKKERERERKRRDLQAPSVPKVRGGFSPRERRKETRIASAGQSSLCPVTHTYSKRLGESGGRASDLTSAWAEKAGTLILSSHVQISSKDGKEKGRGHNSFSLLAAARRRQTSCYACVRAFAHFDFTVAKSSALFPRALYACRLGHTYILRQEQTARVRACVRAPVSQTPFSFLRFGRSGHFYLC